MARRTPASVFRCGSAPGSCTVPLDLGPATDQIFLSLYGTGLRNGSAPAIVTIGGERVEVLYAGPQTAFVGLDQVNAPLAPVTGRRGEVAVALVADGKVSK